MKKTRLSRFIRFTAFSIFSLIITRLFQRASYYGKSAWEEMMAGEPARAITEWAFNFGSVSPVMLSCVATVGAVLSLSRKIPGIYLDRLYLIIFILFVVNSCFTLLGLYLSTVPAGTGELGG